MSNKKQQFSFFNYQPEVDTSNLSGLLGNIPSQTQFVNYDPNNDDASVGSESQGAPTKKKKRNSSSKSSNQPKKKKKTSKKKVADFEDDDDDESVTQSVNNEDDQDTNEPQEFGNASDDEDNEVGGDDDEEEDEEGDSDEEGGKKKKRRSKGASDREGTGRKKTEIAPQLKQMMFGFGDVRNPLPETVSLLEEIVKEYVHEVVAESIKLSKKGKLTPEDLVTTIRHDTKKYLRVDELLKKNEEIRKARVDFQQ